MLPSLTKSTFAL